MLNIHISQSRFVANREISESSSTPQSGSRVPFDPDSPLADSVRVPLNRLLQSSLGAIEDPTVSQICQKLQSSSITIEDLCRRVHDRRSMFTGSKGTWGGVITLLDGMITANAKAERAAARHNQLVLPEEITPDDIAWLKKHGWTTAAERTAASHNQLVLPEEPELTIDQIAEREMRKWRN